MIIDRRRFLATSSMCVAGGASSVAGALTMFLPSRSSSPARIVYPLNRGWLWSPETPFGAQERDFHDLAFTQVTLPHSNVFVPWHSIDQTSYQFISTYRRHFKLPSQHKGQRVFVDFEAAATASKVWLNGTLLGEYFGGFTPFSFELTKNLDWSGENVLCVQVDSHELSEVPPFGYEIDYLTYGGIYREASIRVTSPTLIDKLQVRTLNVRSASPEAEIAVWLDTTETGSSQPPYLLEAELLDGAHVVAQTRQRLTAADMQAKRALVSLRGLAAIRLWQLDAPALYSMRVRLRREEDVLDEVTQRFGFREARFTPRGFDLNGNIINLRGLNRHQSFPFAGPAMPARVQRRDAVILKQELKCNIVRCSHYPQSRHFLDACDELGLLVIDETPGWQHVGESTQWQERYLDNTRRMIERDWNHPSVVLWSVRINESRDFHDLYVKANALARSLDSTRQTTGVRYFQESELLEDVFSMNDFGFPLKEPNHPLYLNTEFVGAEFPVRPWDDNARHREHILRYARIYNQLASDARYAGGLGWCAFDYQTHADFGAGDHICYHGVMDTLRQPKPAAGFFRSQCSPEEEAVLEPGFHFAENDQPGGFEKAVICSNCEEIQCSIVRNGVAKPVVRLQPARDEFPHLAHPPFFLTLPEGNDDWGDLRLDGYVGANLVVSRTCSGKGIDQKFTAVADDEELVADGSDTTRVSLRVTDEYGAVRPHCSDPISIVLEGPGSLLGESLAAFSGGVTAVWVRTTNVPGDLILTARHIHFGERKVTIRSRLAEDQESGQVIL
jgi:beta-galactosidase